MNAKQESVIYALSEFALKSIEADFTDDQKHKAKESQVYRLVEAIQSVLVGEVIE